MSVISDVATYLQAQGIGTLATNLFYSYLPDTDTGTFQVAVLDTGGLQPDPDLPTKEPTFQVYVRSTTYAIGKAKLDAIRSALHRQANIELVTGQTYFYFILAQSEGGHVGQGDSGRDEFSINFHCRTR